jgi:uncharacterized protein (TIGR02453 family)
MSGRPLFSGFPGGGLQFLEDLAQNNNREWFQAHKEVYTEHLLGPAQDFVMALGERLKTISRGLTFDIKTGGRGSILRIYRDLRFSKDKRPYNTNLRVFFWEGSRKKMENPGFFVRIGPHRGEVFGGMHQFPKPFLAAYRDAVVGEQMGMGLDAALASVRGAGKYEIGGEHYKRTPRGYDSDHPRAELLRYNGIYAQAPEFDREVLLKPELVDVCFEHCRSMSPLHRWLVKVGERYGV